MGVLHSVIVIFLSFFSFFFIIIIIIIIIIIFFFFFFFIIIIIIIIIIFYFFIIIIIITIIIIFFSSFFFFFFVLRVFMSKLENAYSEAWYKTKSERKEGNGLFNDALNTFYLRLYGVGHMVKDHSGSERGNPLPTHRLLFPIGSKCSFICTIPQTW